MDKISNLMSRLERIRPAALVVLALLPDGTEREMPVAECVNLGAEFIKVVHGNSLSDLDILLDAFRAKVKAG